MMTKGDNGMETTNRFTGRMRLFQIAHGAIYGLFAAVIPTLLFGFTPFLTLLYMAYGLLGNARYGIVRMSSWEDMKTALIASAIWPYLAWKQYDKELQQPSANITYNARLNDVHVGVITEADYYTIKRRVLHDPRVYLTQLFNVGKVLSKTFDSFVIGIPMLAFWGMLVLAYIEPSIYSDVLAAIQNPDAIRKAAGMFIKLALTLWCIAYGIQAFLIGAVPGFENKFDQEIYRLLRRQLKVAAEGNIELTQTLLLSTSTGCGSAPAH